VPGSLDPLVPHRVRAKNWLETALAERCKWLTTGLPQRAPEFLRAHDVCHHPLPLPASAAETPAQNRPSRLVTRACLACLVETASIRTQQDYRIHARGTSRRQVGRQRRCAHHQKGSGEHYRGIERIHRE
jgi:hypothetical protein